MMMVGGNGALESQSSGLNDVKISSEKAIFLPSNVFPILFAPHSRGENFSISTTTRGVSPFLRKHPPIG